jgi:hypothetical protein
MINNNEQEEQNYWLASDMAHVSVISAGPSSCRIVGIYSHIGIINIGGQI